MHFATRIFKKVDEFLITYVMMVTNIKGYIYISDYDEFGKEFRDLMEGQFFKEFFDEPFTSVVKENESNSLEQRVSDWFFFASNRGPMPDNVYDSSWMDILELVNNILHQRGKYDKKLGRYFINEILPPV